MTIPREDLIWLAGLAEGEFCFDVHRGKYPRVRVGLTDRDITGRAATIMGVGVRLSLKRYPNKPTWHAEVSGPRAADIMRQLLPLMGARRSAKIAEILSVVEFAGNEKGSAPGPRVHCPPGIPRVAA